MIKTTPDEIFGAARIADPFIENEKTMEAFMALPIRDRKRLARHVTILCGVCDGLDPIGALELLEALGKWIVEGGLPNT